MQLPLTFPSIRNVDWKFQRYAIARNEELAEIEKKNKTHINRSWGSKKGWSKRK